jgi:glycosyltransferase involved in cell wall biosynthesis
MITIVSCHHFPDDERVYHRELLTLKKLGQPIQYFTRSNSELDISDDLVRHKNCPAKEFSIKEYITFLKNAFLETPPTIFHFHEYDLLPLARLAKLRFNAQVIYDVHEDIRFLGATFSTRHPLLRNFLISLRTMKEQYHLECVDRVILANPVVGDCIFRDRGFDLLILQNYPFLSFVSNQSNDGCRGRTILYHGHLGPERGIQELVESIIIVRDTIPDVSLILLGTFRTSEFQDYIISMIEKNDLSDNIKWIPQVPHQAVWNYLNEAAIGVIPFRENPLTLNNTPTKLFEFMAAGCGIVASDLPPSRHHVSDSIQWSEPGSVQDIADGLLRLLQNPELLENQSSQNRELITNQLNWECIEPILLDLYKSLEILV